MGVEQWLKIFLKKTANSKYTGKGEIINNSYSALFVWVWGSLVEGGLPKVIGIIVQNVSSFIYIRRTNHNQGNQHFLHKPLLQNTREGNLMFPHYILEFTPVIFPPAFFAPPHLVPPP